MMSTFNMLIYGHREHKNAIKRFLAICLGSCSSLTLLYLREAPANRQFL